MHLDEFIARALPALRGKILVVKYGGSFMDSPDPEAREAVVLDVVELQSAGIRPVVVHGGGKAITRAMEKAGLKPVFVQGMRVTDAATVEVVEQTLSREINPEIVEMISRFGGKARGFSGTEVFTCRKMVAPEGDLGFVGDVTSVASDRLRETVDDKAIPVVSPTAIGPEGKIYNCNADVAAAQTAIALRAAHLVFMSDVPGLLGDPKSPTSVIPQVDAVAVAELKRAGIIDKGMIPKVDSAIAAAQAGVGRVSFIDGRKPYALLLEALASAAGGTRVVS